GAAWCRGPSSRRRWTSWRGPSRASRPPRSPSPRKRRRPPAAWSTAPHSDTCASCSPWSPSLTTRAKASRPSSRSARHAGRDASDEARGGQVMIVRTWVAPGLLLLLLAVGTSWAIAQPSELPATVVTLSGKADWFKKGDSKWNTVDLRNQLQVGDGIRTGPSVRATLRTVGGNAIRLAALTQVFFVPPAPGTPEPEPVRARLDRGWLWVAVTPGTHAQAPIEVLAGPARVAVRDGGGSVPRNRAGSAPVRAPHRPAPVPGAPPPATRGRGPAAGQAGLVPPPGAPAADRP